MSIISNQEEEGEGVGLCGHPGGYWGHIYVLGLSDFEYSLSLVTKLSKSCCLPCLFSSDFRWSSGLYLCFGEGGRVSGLLGRLAGMDGWPYFEKLFVGWLEVEEHCWSADA